MRVSDRGFIRSGMRDVGKHGMGQCWETASSLWDGPRTSAEITAHYRSYARLLGFFNVGRRLLEGGDHGHHYQSLEDSVDQTLSRLLDMGWVVRDGDLYSLTELGRVEAAKPLEDLRKSRALVAKLLQPETVSKTGLIAHLALAAIKLPAGLLSGSVGLINDATDTLLDGVSSLLVYLGLKHNQERLVNVILVVVMLITGCWTAYEGIHRVFVPVPPEADVFAFVAALVSAVVCAGLYAYQRFVGWRGGCLPLLTQSVDSRNHVIVAVSVTAGLVAALLDFLWLDVIVGLIVAGLILWSGFELAIEMVRTMGEGEVDLAQYTPGLVNRYSEFRERQLADWMLGLVSEGRVDRRPALAAEGRAALDFRENPTLRELGLAEAPDAAPTVEHALSIADDHHWLADGPDGRLLLTDEGRAHLRKVLAPRASGRGAHVSTVSLACRAPHLRESWIDGGE